jgi:Flp pilus assembly protein CpaB
MRAYTIHTPTVEAGVVAFIRPGTKVDVLLTREGQGGGRPITLLQNVEILAEQRVGPNLLHPPIQFEPVTLVVTPREAMKLNLDQNKGELHLSLHFRLRC